MKSLIICTSKSHGNTRLVADRMAAVLESEVVAPEAVDPATLRQYGLIGFGSGIYYMGVDARLQNLIRHIPTVDHTRAFTYVTSGAREVPLLSYHKPIRKRLEAKGFEVIGSFSCRGFDTVGPFGLIGGINRGRPDDHDLERAATFAARLRKRVEASPRASMDFQDIDRTLNC
ncbi:flavodoxin family protein [Mycobacterium intracellulare]|uniref:Flavodoxin n=1 Tax=Mycobacterium intracellulare subsp. chimaera TaxID=222805 RepID=A0A7U5RV52_MYCIT|nr:flavodoxin family protein [Mycobacterium intracellulare]ASL15148.1 flavodoxin [Mycobacterium intracellulare subsp. chimaera]ASQ86334.1 flavodoxin [Mycobacterium intracellulare subsp. chimaera]MCF1811674.1 flavodoxin family protein [Mycobacterium intracellulare subsp. intracellulare]MDM3926266.1 flavodoxin family protein [Mycobacterium intracellulare subsp. chimaera]MDS0333215.1 flavodoxin family protein [Mycobacterium intracellulare]